MTTEQREAIDRLQELVNLRKRKNNIKHDTCICGTRDLDTVLFLTKRQEKQLDLMADFISKQDIEENICMQNKTNPDLCNVDYTNCKDCIKQYFENKVNSSEQN